MRYCAECGKPTGDDNEREGIAREYQRAPTMKRRVLVVTIDFLFGFLFGCVVGGIVVLTTPNG